jgi:hypothetical protein
MRAASLVPSESGIQTFSISLTLRGNSLIVVMVMKPSEKKIRGVTAGTESSTPHNYKGGHRKQT